MDKDGRAQAEGIIRQIQAGATTNLSGGFSAGVQALSAPVSRGGGSKGKNEVQSILLLTDGLANVGIRDTAGMVNLVKESLKAIPSASVFTFGYGKDHDSDMLRAISDVGKGVYYFVQAVDDIPSAFADCLGGLLSVVGQNILLKCDAVAGARIKKIHSRFPVQVLEEGQRYEVSVGDMYAEEDRDIVVEMSIPVVAATGEVEPPRGASFTSAQNITVQAQVSESSGQRSENPESQQAGFLNNLFRSFRRSSPVPPPEPPATTPTPPPAPPTSPSEPTEAVAESVPPAISTTTNITTAVTVAVPEPIIHFSVEYTDVLEDNIKSANSTVAVARPRRIQGENKADVELMKNLNRIVVAQALDAGQERGDNNDFEGANNVMENAKRALNQNMTLAGLTEVEDEMGFMDELQQVQETLCDYSTYQSVGKHTCVSRAQTHWVQRSNESKAAPTFKGGYRKSKKMSMVNKMKR